MDWFAEHGDGTTNPLISRRFNTTLSPPPRTIANSEDLYGFALDPVADEIRRHGDAFTATAADAAAALGVVRQAGPGGQQAKRHPLGGQGTERADVEPDGFEAGERRPGPDDFGNGDTV